MTLKKAMRLTQPQSLSWLPVKTKSAMLDTTAMVLMMSRKVNHVPMSSAPTAYGRRWTWFVFNVCGGVWGG